VENGQATKQLILIGGLASPAKTALVYSMACTQRGSKSMLLLTSIHDEGWMKERAPDHLIVKRMPSGCVCCTTACELLNELNIISKNHQVDSVVIDLSDLADIDQILTYLSNSKIKSAFHIAEPIIAIDSGCRFFKKKGEIPLINRMIRQNFRYVIASVTDESDFVPDNFSHLIASVGADKIHSLSLA
jgi:G3E family GTPase